MKITQETRQVTGEGLQRSRNFTIDCGAHIMAVLSGLYKNPLDAILREYLTNMLDAYLALGPYSLAEHPYPILHLPTAFEPYLEFKDFGIGMSADTVWNIYATYGASTKNSNNDEVGGFGLGSKTAFCYQNGQAWTIESRFNGEKFLFMASLDENSLPTLYHASTTETDEPNGVTIRIPILRQDITTVHKAADKYIPYFPMKLNVTGTDKTEYKKLESLFSGPSWRIRPYREYGISATVVMGNVPYTLDSDLLSAVSKHLPFLRHSYGLEVEMETPIGTVDLVPSRDHLKSTERTKNQLELLCKNLHKEMAGVIKDTYDSFSNKWDRTAWTYKMGKSGFRNFFGDDEEVIDALNGNYTISTPSNSVVDVHTIARYEGTYDKKKEVSKVTVEVIENLFVVRDDGVRNIDQVARWYVQDKCFAKTRTGRKSKRGHRSGMVITVSSNLSDDDILTYLGNIPKTHFIGKASQFSEKARTMKERGVENIYRLYNGKTWGARVRLPKESTVYYVVMTRPDGHFRWDFPNLAELQHMSRIAEIPFPKELYGVRSEEVQDFENRKGWINFDKLVMDTFVSWIDNYISTNPNVASNSLTQYESVMPWITEFLTNEFVKTLSTKNKKVKEWVSALSQYTTKGKYTDYHIHRIIQGNKILKSKVDANDKKIKEKIDFILSEIKTNYPMLWAMVDVIQAESSYRNTFSQDSVTSVLKYLS